LSADHDRHVRASFARQAAGFDAPGLTLSSEELLRWMVGLLPLRPYAEVLDVAAGTGILTRAMARFAHAVTAVDMTDEMLAQARAAVAEAGLNNVSIVRGRAESLPFEYSAFDLVTARLAVHHLADAAPVLHEMVRVCRPGGCVALIDLTSPDDGEIRDAYNRLERLRDPAHTVALTPAEIAKLCADAELNVEVCEARDVEVDCARWLALTDTPEQNAEAVRSALQSELSGGPATGMRPFERDGSLWFLQRWAVVLARRL
jgi:SAM-dependent methyltransferase